MSLRKTRQISADVPDCRDRKSEDNGGRKCAADGGRKGLKRSASRVQCSVSGQVCQVPMCGLSLPDAASLEQHYQVHLHQELEKLGKVKSRKPGATRSQAAGSSLVETRFRTYTRLRDRRLRRAINQSTTSTAQESGGVLCQVCDEEVPGSLEDHSQHVSACLRVERSEGGGESDDSYVEVEVEEGEEYEEYEWAGQSRIRATSLLRGGLAGAGFLTIQKTAEDQELDVTGDFPEDCYGPVQYTEECLHTVTDDNIASDVNHFQSASSSATTTPTTAVNTPATTPSPSTTTFLTAEIRPSATPLVTTTVTGCDESSGKNHPLPSIDSPATADNLRGNCDLSENAAESGHDDESQNATAKMNHGASGSNNPSELGNVSGDNICKICMDRYEKHVVSTVCWHVHCETCWMRALATKKLCPQCKVIVRPQDLRKIYI